MHVEGAGFSRLGHNPAQKGRKNGGPCPIRAINASAPPRPRPTESGRKKGRRDPQCVCVWRVLVLVRVQRVQSSCVSLAVLESSLKFFWREQFLEGSLGALSSLLELSSLEFPLTFYKEQPWICYSPSKLPRSTGPTSAVEGKAARTQSGTPTEL